MTYLFFLVLCCCAMGQAQSSRGSTSKVPGAVSGPDLLVSFRGTITQVDGKKLTLALEESTKGEENSIEFSFSRKTEAYVGSKKVKLGDLKRGQPAAIDSKRLLDGRIEAVTIRVEAP